jgi:hypothetical protein
MPARRWYASCRLLTEIPVAYPLSNVLIDALPEDSRKRLLANLKRTPIPVRTSIYEPGDMPKYGIHPGNYTVDGQGGEVRT